MMKILFLIFFAVALVSCSENREQSAYDKMRQPTEIVTCYLNDGKQVYKKEAIYTTSSSGTIHVKLPNGKVDYVQGNCFAEQM